MVPNENVQVPVRVAVVDQVHQHHPHHQVVQAPVIRYQRSPPPPPHRCLIPRQRKNQYHWSILLKSMLRKF